MLLKHSEAGRLDEDEVTTSQQTTYDPCPLLFLQHFQFQTELDEYGVPILPGQNFLCVIGTVFVKLSTSGFAVRTQQQ